MEESGEHSARRYHQVQLLYARLDHDSMDIRKVIRCITWDLMHTLRLNIGTPKVLALSQNVISASMETHSVYYSNYCCAVFRVPEQDERRFIAYSDPLLYHRFIRRFNIRFESAAGYGEPGRTVVVHDDTRWVMVVIGTVHGRYMTEDALHALEHEYQGGFSIEIPGEGKDDVYNCDEDVDGEESGGDEYGEYVQDEDANILVRGLRRVRYWSVIVTREVGFIEFERSLLWSVLIAGYGLFVRMV